MAIPSQAVRNTARAALKGNWLMASSACLTFLLAVTLIYFSCSLLSSVIPDIIATIILYVLIVFLLSPIFLGLIRFFKNLIFETNIGLSEIFIYLSAFSAYKRALKLILELLARLLFYSAICFLPAGTVKLITTDFFFGLLNIDIPLWSQSLDTLLSFLLGMGALATFIIMLRYYLAPFLLVSDDNMAVDEAIHMATVISRRSSNELWSLILSFSGYILLTVFMIPLIFTLPYFLCALAVHSRFAITNYNLTIAKAYNFKENSL